MLSGLRMAFAKEQSVDPERNLVIRFVRRFIPVSTAPHGQRFLVREAGRLCFTPLMVILLVLESTDIVFAVDSVPAVFGVTKEPLIVYTSNVFAILGLRAMYFLLSGALDLFHYLKYGLSFVLVFVGVKMAVLDDLAGGRLPIGISLAVIATTVLSAVALSLLFPRTPRAPRMTLPAWTGRVTLGAVFIVLRCASVAIAAGVRPRSWILPVSMRSKPSGSTFPASAMQLAAWRCYGRNGADHMADPARSYTETIKRYPCLQSHQNAPVSHGSVLPE